MPRKKQKPTPTRKQRRIKARRRRRALDRAKVKRFRRWCERYNSTLPPGWYKKMIDREGDLEVGAGLLHKEIQDANRNP